MEGIDHAVANVLKFLMKPKPQKAEYSRAEQASATYFVGL